MPKFSIFHNQETCGGGGGAQHPIILGSLFRDMYSLLPHDGERHFCGQVKSPFKHYCHDLSCCDDVNIIICVHIFAIVTMFILLSFVFHRSKTVIKQNSARANISAIFKKFHRCE